MSPKRVLFEDSALLAVDKPPGVVVHATVDTSRDHLLAAVTRWLEARDGAVGHLRLVHRLDRETSGVILFSRSPAADAALAAEFSERRADKTYWAIAADPQRRFPRAPTMLHAYLAPGRGPRGTTAVVRSGGQPAQTVVRSIGWRDGFALIEARPRTGRTHQIRVQLAKFGYPILGDTQYGGADPDVKRLLLHAAGIELAHPTTQEPVSIGAPSPRAFRARFETLPEHAG